MADWTYAEALREGLRDAMAQDPHVIILGEDVAYGGPFGVTRGLKEAFGSERVRNTPISEAAVVGFATGAALAGYRPVVEVMFMDFLTLTLDMLVNQAAKYRYLAQDRLRVPLVVRTQAGVLQSAGAHHSQSFESWLVHVPGLSVLAPSTAGDAYQAIRWALRQSDPVVVMEHKALYGRRTARQPAEDLEVGWVPRATRRRAGEDATVISYSAMIYTALEAADRLAREGIEVEVWDLMGLSDSVLDLEPVVEAVERTHRALVVHEAVRTGGFGAEVAARLQEVAFDALDAPIVRLGAKASPVPFSPPLEQAYLPSAEDICQAVRNLMA